jgi:hypothetical protein
VKWLCAVLCCAGAALSRESCSWHGTTLCLLTNTGSPLHRCNSSSNRSPCFPACRRLCPGAAGDPGHAAPAARCTHDNEEGKQPATASLLQSHCVVPRCFAVDRRQVFCAPV